MSANPLPTWREGRIAGLRPMTLAALDGVIALEEAVYPFPWTRGNFVDSLAAGYLAWTLNGPGGELVAYSVAMRGADELHLLNITVAPPAQRCGHARRLIGELARQGRVEGVRTLWLEVRASNEVGQATYMALGFGRVGVRRGYYPAPGGTREDAVVMSLPLDGQEPVDALD